jgi:hypothetical protein
MTARGQAIHAYWEPGRDPKACAEQLAAGLRDLERLDERFRLQLAVGSPNADENLTYAEPTAGQILSDGWVPVRTAPRGGFLSLGLWNGLNGPGEAGLQLVCGAAGGNMALPGQCLVDLPATLPAPELQALARQVMTWAVKAFDPAWAILADDEIREALDWQSTSPELGPITYVREPMPVSDPAGTRIVALHDGYLVELSAWTPDTPWSGLRAVAAVAQEQLRADGYLGRMNW